jgi:hypothetical protein
VHYIEDWNEPDKTWEDRNAFFLPFEYAAMSSADVDGHLGTMGGTVGIRNADPTAKFVMAGMAGNSGINLDYFKSLKYWCDQNRAGNYPWDVLNVHIYCNDAPLQPSGQATTGVSPEAFGLRSQVAALVDYRNTFLHGKEVWVSEFGYDVNSLSIQRAPAIGSTCADEVQGEWIVRSFLALAGAGADRAFLFMDSDPGMTNDFTQYATSGVIENSSEGFAVRPAWFYCKTLKERLRGFRYYADQSSGNTNVTIYQFTDATGAINAYAVWCPTTNNTTVSGYSLALQGSPASATLVTLSNGCPAGATSALTISGGAVTINVSEKPVLVLTGPLQTMDLPDTQFVMNTNMVNNTSGLGDATLMVDEQSLVADPPDGQGGNPSTIWFPSWNSGDYPASAYIDLGQVVPITKFYLYDLNSAGLVTVSTGTPGNWQPLFTDDMRNWATWNLHVLNVRTRYIQITREDEGGNFGEVAVFTNPWLNQFGSPTVASLTQSNGNVTLTGSCVPGSSVMIWATTNLTPPVVWEPVATNTVDETGFWQFIETPPLGVQQRFYRANMQ